MSEPVNDLIMSFKAELEKMKEEISELKSRVLELESNNHPCHHHCEEKCNSSCDECCHSNDPIEHFKHEIGLGTETQVELFQVTPDDLSTKEVGAVPRFTEGTPKENVFNNTRITTGKGKKKEIRCVSSTFLDRDCDLQLIWKDQNTCVIVPSLVFYIEIKLSGTTKYNWISLGAYADKNMYINHHIGWDKKTIGIHSDDGKVYVCNGQKPFDCTTYFGPGDVIGCGWKIKEKSIFFTRNGKYLKAFDFPFKVDAFAIGMKEFELIEVINGEETPFMFDLVSFVEGLAKKEESNEVPV
ncbi:hypothetical protein EIN_056520 [Entamoeba invadens IP1]|uniref:hypothetical protein n=1 Tax=Entamoeba invadens IP1 TaxID=370355 RepID=UPI0002C3DA0A|nr:hypothetical protein EIN_056520 [Entamoeba invadens IP1]ELP93277.1 hypothetical protein EIN_056520 [Entamoeba invadens IP1]|eukprot:XP_004260048.1 hypothetical protein EIN_056520 [Entamoeba invadens IP1]